MCKTFEIPQLSDAVDGDPMYMAIPRNPRVPMGRTPGKGRIEDILPLVAVVPCYYTKQKCACKGQD